MMIKANFKNIAIDWNGGKNNDRFSQLFIYVCKETLNNTVRRFISVTYVRGKNFIKIH